MAFWEAHLINRDTTAANPLLLSSLQRHLETLKRTAHGAVLYGHIERGLQKYTQENGQIDRVYLTYLYVSLGKYAKDPACDPGTRVKARFIQQRLMLYLPEESHFPTTEPAPSAEPMPDRRREPAPLPKVDSVVIAMPARPQKDTQTPPHVEVSTIAEDITVGEEFGELLESERESVSTAGNPLGDFSDLKQTLIKGLNELIEERQAMIKKLSDADEYLKAVEHDRQQLRHDLKKARKHGSTDELTGLPKRDVFIRQLEAEIGRAKRYGFSLALALIDIDGLEQVNSRCGRAAGDAVLRCYASTVLSKFRTYDLVARYGEDEFVVLFPNTQKEGVMHALEKAQKTVAGTCIRFDGQNIPLPTFSSVLTIYAHGEKADALLQRADEALDHAKIRGQNQLVIAFPAA